MYCQETWDFCHHLMAFAYVPCVVEQRIAIDYEFQCNFFFFNTGV
jgi:hypothetical protein